MTTVIRSNTAADASLPVYRRSPVLETDTSNGARCMFSLDFPWCFAGTVADGATVRNMAYNVEDAFDMALQLTAGQTVTHAGGGLDFSAMTAGECYVEGNAGCLSTIDVGSQYFLVIAWMKLPASADWNDESVLLPIFTTTDDGSNYTTQSDMLTIAQQSGPLLTARRQTDGGATVAALSITPDSTLFGNVCQIAYWRNASETRLRVKSKFGEKTATGASGSANSGDFSARLPKWGVPGSFTDLATLSGHRDGTNTRLYRGLLEDLGASGRAPLAVADADWSHVLNNTSILA